MQMNATTSAPARQRKPRPKPARSIRLCVQPHEQGPAVVRIAVGPKSNDYLLTPVACDYGKGFRLEKIGAEESYHVNIDGDKKTCECKGHARHGHCKHVDGLAALIAAGLL
jgi:hypothetical protein